MSVTGVLNTKGGMIAVAVLAGGVVIYFFGRRIAKGAGDAADAIADAVGGVFSGNNRLTEGTPYEGAGIAGTLGAAANTVSGGVLGRFGSWIGGQIYDIANKPYDPNQRSFTSQVLGPAVNVGPVRPEDKPSSWR